MAEYNVSVGNVTNYDVAISLIEGVAGEGGGDSTITSTTATTITGLLKGASGKIAQAIAGSDYASAGHTHSGTYEPANANIQSHIIATTAAHGGIVASTDARLTDARTPTAHIHGNITNSGAIGSTANLPVITGTDGILSAGSFGVGSTVFCVGNDSRLSDARTPTAHNQAVTTITGLNSTIGFQIGSGKSVPSTGSYCLFKCPFGHTIDSWHITGSPTGTAIADIYVNGASAIGSGNKPTLANTQTASANVSGWSTTTISQNSIYTININTITACTLLDIQLRVTRT